MSRAACGRGEHGTDGATMSEIMTSSDVASKATSSRSSSLTGPVETPRSMRVDDIAAALPSSEDRLGSLALVLAIASPELQARAITACCSRARFRLAQSSRSCARRVSANVERIVSAFVSGPGAFVSGPGGTAFRRR
jgi:hypothetical protein